MLSFFASQKVKDTASGMRVVRSSILDEIYPLPDGLHFTPAMSAKAVTNPEIKIFRKEHVLQRERRCFKTSYTKRWIEIF